VSEQDPSVHVGVALTVEQALPQLPQLDRSVSSVTSQPVDAVPSQSSYPESQLAISHVELVQVGVALASVHWLPHAPQSLTVLLRSVSHGVPRSPSHSARGVVQVEYPQTLFTQAGVPLVDGQTVPQPPQLLTLLVVFVSQPLT
jgi:hypothetical protein